MGLLELAGVSKRFQRGREEVVALDGVDLTVEAGEFLSVIGPSGSGKSTLLHLAGGLDRPDAGRVLLNGTDVGGLNATGLARLRRREIGFVFQFFHLVPTLTVAENVELPLLLDGRRNTAAAVGAMIERVGLTERAAHLPGELSGGEMQRVAIARALIAEPRLILADEPTGNLDSTTGAAILDVLAGQVADAGAALVMVTHDLAAASRAHHVVHLRDGKLADGEESRVERHTVDGAATATVARRARRPLRTTR